MRRTIDSKKLDQVAAAIDRLVIEMDLPRLPLEVVTAALVEIGRLVDLLGPTSPALEASLLRLQGVLEQRPRLPQAPIGDAGAVLKLRRALKLLAPLAAAALALSAMPLAAATTPPPPPASLIGTATVGGTVFNPITGKNETVTTLIGTYAVRTSLNNVILLATKVGDTYTVVDTGVTPNVSTVYTVTAVTLNTNNVVTDVTVKAGSAATTTTTSVVQAVNPSVAGSGGGGTGTSTAITFTPAAGDVNQFTNYQKGGNGGAGNPGGGVGFCIPLIGCVTIGKSPTAGGAGSNGPLVESYITPSNGDITTVSLSLPGIIVVSAGGDGGNGGNSYALSDGNVLAGAAGGAAGNGGTAIAHVSVGSITTSGAYSHGILVQSMAGAAGAGGIGYGNTNGGGGGTAAQGGSASAYNSAQIVTTGKGAVGILVQSLGGSAGSGGGSYGIVGLPGSGSVGGNGGAAYAENSGAILTKGESAHGMLVQSIGGAGGNSGSGGGIVVLGSSSGVGGNGGTATGKLLTGGSITTEGNYANGLMVQSVGGGGGSGGVSGGLVALGASGGAAGVGTTASAITQSGSSILTKGDYSYGILVESIGGGGGSAGSTGGLVSIGASGGSGGAAGNVSVTADGTVETRGTGSRGIFAQSVGGGGGNAGYTGGAVAIGGSGSLGGTGGTVDVSVGSTGGVATLGKGADAIFAQSVGGGGGAGSYAGGIVSLGGSGGPGAGGGIVTVSNAGTITTGNTSSRGIFAQSVGGGGGSGGDTGGLVSIGGTGGGTSAGGNVTVSNSGAITTAGNRSYGLQAQSIGGGGGDGGTSGGVFLSIGGSGAAGGTGGIVTVNQSGAISTSGADSHALFAQSVGGGGGNGGSSTSISLFSGLAIGGSGSIGGMGGDTTVNFTPKSITVGGAALSVDPQLVTLGDRSRGVFAQSVGGGGGSGGFAISTAFGLGFSEAIGIGGSGGGGNTGGLVKASGNADVSTSGANSEGMFFQSAGGGGGSGGFSIATSVTAGKASLSAGIGGTGGSGGDGGTLNVLTGGSIITRGLFSTGFVAQSVGGGGGTGGYAISAAVAFDPLASLAVGVGIGGSGGGGGRGGDVTATFDGTISTGGSYGLGSDAIGALIQSVGGGGGRGGFSIAGAASTAALGSGAIAFGLGGSGGTGGSGGVVIGTVGGNVLTSGDRSAGVLIQSVGGGGGSGGFNISGAMSVSAGVAGSAAIGLGGTGGTAGVGGTVTGTAKGSVATYGEGSDGVVVQSLGGGGGSGGFNISGAMGISGGATGNVSVGLGGAGGGGGDGGIATGSALGVVETFGARSRGVVVQSLGGGGGAGAFNVDGSIAISGGVAGNVGVGLGGSGGSGGTAKLVTAIARSITTHDDQSTGFIAQSVGGGGGTGGFNVTAGIAISGGVAGNVGIGLGGSGGSGGGGGQVIAGLIGNVVTSGDQSGGIVAQSLGGGGGTGAFNVTGGLSVSGGAAGTVGVGIGGSGGTGGSADTVDLTLAGAAGTSGKDSDAIVAQSVGGGGGSGAFNVTGAVSLAGGGAGAVGFGLGGTGGSGGDGARVGVLINDKTTTSNLAQVAASTGGFNSRGIVAQSLGGGGGSGAFNVTGAVTLAGGGGGAISVGIGGSGGSGGKGGVVAANISGATGTSGDSSDGIFIQSLGGGGGAGAFNITGAVALTGGGAGAVSVGLGGSGGSGGTSNSASLNLNKDVVTPDKMLLAASTLGADSRGIVVQSLGGGGGSGAFNITGAIAGSGGGAGAVSVGIGGAGGSGGFAGDANADITGRTLTAQDNSGAVLVQSLGGGGGAGGFTISGAVGLSGGVAGAVSVGIGGSGGGGGAGGAANLFINQRTANSGADLVAAATQGKNSAGIVAQSLGGGGGSGGFNISGAVALAGTGSGAVSVGIGGSGGNGGAAGDVTAAIRGQTTTSGDGSDGIVAQAIGGGGGSGGFAIAGALAASGTGSGAVSVGLGGSGGSGGLGGVVKLDINKNTTATQSDLIAVSTSGIGSRGIVAQSLGGGGGVGGFSFSGAVALAGTGSGVVSVGIGGSGGGGKDGLGVTSNISGATLTSGAQSDGIFLQSVGGGGGSGAFNVSAGLAVAGQGAGSVAVGIGGSGGGGGSAGAVTLNVNQLVSIPTIDLIAARTLGDESRGIVAQSIGGGGGDGGFNISGGVNLAGKGAGGLALGIGGSGGGGGGAGMVTADITGATFTNGMNSGGVLLQSLGGGGGSGAFNVSGSLSAAGKGAGSLAIGIGGSGAIGGVGGAVVLDLNQRTSDAASLLYAANTLGDNSAGIIAQSVGGGGGSGGFNISGGVALAGDAAGAVTVGLGGTGGGGNNASTVTANIRGTTATTGFASNGVLAQSVGGGGGAGAFNVSGGLAAASKGGGTVSVGLGGAAGSGGSADTVRLTINGGTTDNRLAQIAAITQGDESRGVIAQSLGGGGGMGGFNVSGAVSLASTAAGAVSVGLGGSGGSGGNAGLVFASIAGSTITTGANSGAVLAQSIGGGGGGGGFNVSGSLAGASTGAGTVSVGIGGSGGGGGFAQAVDLKINSEVVAPVVGLLAAFTGGINSNGIVAQSLGGGGGNGGFNISGSISLAGKGAGAVSVGIGGSGGDGGIAGAVHADITGTTVTTLSDSKGILAQSIGGGGGNGGFDVAGGIAIGGKGAGTVSVGIGGSGGGGGKSGEVILNVNQRSADPLNLLTAALTSGDRSTGIIAQSIGGGGGDGGFNVSGGIAAGSEGAGNLGFGLGGGGGTASDGDQVIARIAGDIGTSGLSAGGLFLQSAGGGGGSGGFNVSGGVALSKKLAGNIMVGIGGMGAGGGDGKLVDGQMVGDIATTKDGSYGATLQSVGGSGGVGGMNITGGISISTGTTGAGTLGVGIGGFGGGGGNGGEVRGGITGSIQTAGDNAHGALFQSLGGGGGDGGLNVTGGIAISKGTTGTVGFGLGGFGGDGGNAGIVNATLAGNVTTSGRASYGAMFQSVGGAGGAGALNVTGGINITKGDSSSGGVSIGIGGFGGGGGNASSVTASSDGVYSTDGRDSAGVIALSLGGGGGAGGLNVSGALTVSTQGNGGAVALGLGGFGGDGGKSGDVTLTRAGNTITRQSASDGVVAQSIGGGGGRGAINISAGIAGTNTGNAGSVVLGMGGFGGGGGDAGLVTATVRDSVWAMGSDAATSFYPSDYVLSDGSAIDAGTKTHLINGSNGVVVESIGGGGGSGGMNISGGISLAKANKDSTGSALVLGIGGFGGSGGNAGIVNATVGAVSGPRIQVQGTGDNKSAIYVASIGGGGGDGGINISGGLSTDGQVVAGFGGGGSGGGLGKAVTATVNADLFASGYQAGGLTVQSLGGGGGAGGINISGGFKPRQGTEPVIVFGMGGNGGAGNSSGNVTVGQDGQVVVDGYNSHGVLVQSIAGGGGAGGMDIVANVNRSDGKSAFDGFAAGIGMGGSGGKGSVAGNVSLRSTGNVLINTLVGQTPDGVITLAAGSQAGLSAGVTAQSIGGGGGVGGFNIVGIYAPKGNPLTVAIGGSGGVGGDAGTVTLDRGYLADGTTSASLINTFGFGSAGLVAQSIGGGGGNAGSNLSFAKGSTLANETGYAGLIQIGGDGASSGNASTVTVRHFGIIQTDGQGSDGILAQSIGKGGGNAAVNIGISLVGEDTAFRADSTKTSTVNGFTLAVGGGAGDAGSAGAVSVSHDGTIVTKQMMSSAIVAQSLAGGGGNTALNLATLRGVDNGLKVAIGREGGKGGVSGDVSVTSKGLLITSGKMSNGIVAQSIGGAGGLSGTSGVEGQLREGSGKDSVNNGFAISLGLEGGAGGHSDTVTVVNSADIQTSGENARGIIAQSIGGDGGVAGSALALTMGQANSFGVALGGGGGVGATSSKVKVGNAGLILTTGESSDGILAQSIGGGGGVAGSATTIKRATGLEKESSTTVAVAVGGSGGAGAVAGAVEVRNDGIISTQGDNSYGIRAQSIGGGGGVGGSVYNVEMVTAKTVNMFNLNIGGGGGGGQAAGRVDVFNYGIIRTTGVGASGISANSIGGGGGDAGSVATLTKVGVAAGGDTNALQIAIGGSGGSGGTGGAIHVVNAPNGTTDSGTIITTNRDAHGIFAQSLGGGGGNGSSIASIYLSNGAAGSISLGVNLGGAGGTGNTGGEVLVENGGLIHTQGDGSDGILAQSIGGGGGNGGSLITTNILAKSKDKSPLIAIGGIGGAGNDGGHVTVINSGRIFTEGKNADGIVAQSIGGGGGNAGFGLALTGEKKTLIVSNLMSLLVGSIGGGNAGKGGQVDVIHSGDITVTGAGSQAIVAESINGGGGHIQFDLRGISLPSISTVAPGLSIPPLGSIDGIPNLVAGEPVNKPVAPVIVATRLGASDATSMNAGKVNVKITGTIGAAGDYGAGATIRSIGGGGGALDITASLVKPEPLPVAPAGAGITTAAVDSTYTAAMIYAVGLGSKNSTDNAGASIESAQTGDLITTGKATPALLVQSIGGGGGSALVNVETEDLALVDSVRFGLGSVASSNSDGGDVTRTQSGNVFTLTNFSNGALIQSIGGGGGSAFGRVALVTPPVASPLQVAGVQRITGVREALDAQSALAVTSLAPAVVSLGAIGGSGNDGGAINLSFAGNFTTVGVRANGLVVQSIGAGGGQVMLDGLNASSIILGGQAGASGSGGTVTVANNGLLTTYGTGANGILLQSIGGGGGALFGAGPNPNVTLSSANSGDGAAVRLTQTGDVAVLGDHATGIIAQSLGGGGGRIDDIFSGTAGGVGRGGTIDLLLNGQVYAPGAGSVAVTAQSLGSRGGSNINITALGSLRGGSGTGVAAIIDGGKDNLLTSNVALSAVSGNAVTATSGNDTVINNGLAVGNFRLGAGTNALINSAGATLVTIDTLDLQDGVGSSGTFTNAGNLMLGQSASKYPVDLAAGEALPIQFAGEPKTDLLSGTAVISRVALDGNIVLTPTSHSVWDVAFGPYASDKISATGNAAVNGTADVTVTWLENNKPVTLISTGGSAVDNGLKVKDTLALDFSIVTAPNAINLAFTSNFGLSFLKTNERALGGSFDSALVAGNSGGIGRLLALLGNLTAGQESLYKSIMAELDPGLFVAPQLVQFDAARDFGSNVLGCREVDRRDNRACVWGYAAANRYQRSTDRGEYRFDQHDGNRMRMGVELPLGADWQAGAAFGYDDLGDMRYDNDRAIADGEAVHAGVALARSFGDRGQGTAKLSLTGGLQTVDLTRRQSVFVSAVGSSHYQTDYLGGTAEIGYSVGTGPLFARPSIEGSMFRLGQGRFTEQGLGGLGIAGLRHHEWIGTVSPRMTVGARLGTSATFSLNAGGVFHEKSVITAPLRIIGANPSADPAMIRSRFDKTAWSGGFDLVVGNSDKVSVDLGYRGEFGKSVTSHDAHFTFRAKF